MVSVLRQGQGFARQRKVVALQAHRLEDVRSYDLITGGPRGMQGRHPVTLGSSMQTSIEGCPTDHAPQLCGQPIEPLADRRGIRRF
jgi:hypothetical protein